MTPLLSSLLRSTAWGRVWPAEFAVKIVRRQVKANAENPGIVFQLIWPFGESTSGFDPLSPRLRDTAIQELADELPEEERDFIKQINST